MASETKAQRIDARANRERILAAAREAFAADPAASLNAIGAAAGVGAGTLYRHFPSREALLVGVYRREIDSLTALAPALLAAEPASEALRAWCGRFGAFGAVKHGLAETLRAAVDADLRYAYQPLVEAVRQLLSACEAAGQVRAGIDPEDLLTLLSCTLRIAPDAQGHARVQRVLALIFRAVGADDALA